MGRLPAVAVSDNGHLICDGLNVGEVALNGRSTRQHERPLALPRDPRLGTAKGSGRPLHFNHRLGSCGVSFFAAPSLYDSCTKRFPACLDGAPLLMPADDSAVGQRLRAWLQARSLRPRVVGECDDSALAKEFGRRGMGIFVGPTVLERDIEKQYGVRALGATPDVVEEFFAISVERRITHPCVTAITEAARNELFAPPARRRARRVA